MPESIPPNSEQPVSVPITTTPAPSTATPTPTTTVQEPAANNKVVIISIVVAIALTLASLVGVWIYQKKQNDASAVVIATSTPKPVSTPTTSSQTSTTVPGLSTAPASQTTSSTTPASLVTLKNDFIKLDATPPIKYNLSYPSTWGPLTTVTTDKQGIITGPFKGMFEGANQPIDATDKIKSLVFTGFPYTKTSTTTSSLAPSVSLIQYSDSYKDDSSTDSLQPLTAAEKLAIIKPLTDIYSASSLKGVNVEQQNLVTKKSDKLLKGGWWGNQSTNTDKIAPVYMESADKSLRGVGFFMNESQDTTFIPQYHIVLINPTTKTVFQLMVPLDNLSELKGYILNPTPSATPDQSAIDTQIKSGYDYLSKVALGSTDLAKLLSQLTSVASSLTPSTN